jgi:isocitrate dehydrogenase
LALAVSLEDYGNKQNNGRAKILAQTLDDATEEMLGNNKSPSRKTGELDNRGSHFCLSMYWAKKLAEQTTDSELAAQFAPLAKALAENETQIIDEFKKVQGQPTDIGGYYHPDLEKLAEIMCPSETFNQLLASANA